MSKYQPPISEEKIRDTTSASFMDLMKTPEGRELGVKILDTRLMEPMSLSKDKVDFLGRIKPYQGE